MSEENKSEFVSRRMAGAITTVAGGFLLVVMVAAYNYPEKADNKIEAHIAEVERELDEHRATYNEHRANAGADLKELRSLVEAGTDDRYKGKDAKKDFDKREAIDDEREQRTRSDISRLEKEIDRLKDERAQEKRIYRTQ